MTGPRPDPAPARTGLCVVRVETDAAAGLLITVTAQQDLDDARSESVLRTTSVDAAADQVAAFLRAFGRAAG
jgi:hypothetical protein